MTNVGNREKSGSQQPATTTPTQGKVNVTVSANPHVPVVFADSATDFWMLNGFVWIMLETARKSLIAPAAIDRVIIGQLVMPVATAQALAVGLYDFLRQNGVAPPGFEPGARAQ